MGSASSVFLAVTVLSLVIASTRTAGRPDEDDGNSGFLKYPHDPVRPPGSKQRKNNEGLSRRQSRDVAGRRVGVVTHEGYCPVIPHMISVAMA
jgi:hypothetical protein